jgi:acyl-CoA thioester hydrolase
MFPRQGLSPLSAQGDTLRRERARMSRRTHTTYYRVIYGDCDSMDIVYYANYLRLFEIGRTELLRDLGLTYREVEEKGFFLPTTEAYVKYHNPAL